MTTVPNVQPRVDPDTVRLAVIGECPGIEESTCQRCSRGHRFALQYWEEKRLQTRDRCPVPECCSREFTADPTPFVGWSGRLLDDVLAEAGLPREKVFVGNVCQVTQTAAELADHLNPYVPVGLVVLQMDLTTFRPNVVLCLGNTALRAFHSDAKASVTNWRGSLFASTFLDGALPSTIHPDAIRPVPPVPPGLPPPGVASPLSPVAAQCNDRGNSTYVPVPPLKCTASYHPAAVLRTPGWTALLRFDVARAVKEAATPVLTLPERYFKWQLTADEIIACLNHLTISMTKIGFDLEGWAATGMTDCSFATSPLCVFWVPLKHIDGTPWWPPITEQRIMAALRSVLEDPAVSKVCHAGTYEGFVLAWAHGITLRGLADDTMLMWHELNPELDKGLETPASLLTTQPYWGTSRDATTEEERAVYNCTDSAVTLEIADVMRPMLV